MVLDRCCARSSCWNGGLCAGGARCSWEVPVQSSNSSASAAHSWGTLVRRCLWRSPCAWSTAHACRTQCGFVRSTHAHGHSYEVETQLCPFWVLREVLKRCHGADSCMIGCELHQSPYAQTYRVRVARRVEVRSWKSSVKNNSFRKSRLRVSLPAPAPHGFGAW